MSSGWKKKKKSSENYKTEFPKRKDYKRKKIIEKSRNIKVVTSINF